MGSFKIRYMVAKKKKSHTLYYWQPKQIYVQQGFLPRRLAEKTNLLEDAVKEAQQLNAELDEWRKTGDNVPRLREGTLKWVTHRYQESRYYKKLSPNTQRGYDQWIKAINDYAGEYPLTAISRQVCKTYYHSLANTSLSRANAIMRVFRLVMGFAVDEGLIENNPASKMKLVGTDPRTEVWSREEIREFTKHAIAEGKRSVALAVKLAEWLGQRQGDILKMTWAQYKGKTITLKQGKTGAFIEIPCSVELRGWLSSAKKESDFIVVSETTGRPYKEDNFRHIFAELMESFKINGEKVEGKQFRDLRRTAAVRLAEAGCTTEEVVAVTGHKIESGSQILETYLPRNAAMAKNAIDKLERHRKR